MVGTYIVLSLTVLSHVEGASTQRRTGQTDLGDRQLRLRWQVDFVRDDHCAP